MAFPNVAGYMQETIRAAKSSGYTTTLFGRRRLLRRSRRRCLRLDRLGRGAVDLRRAGFIFRARGGNGKRRKYGRHKDELASCTHTASFRSAPSP